MDMSKKDVSVLAIPRHIIESGDISYTLKGVKSGQYTPIEPLHIVVDGYNEDQREIYEIPEVKRYFKRLVKRHSDWLKTSISTETIMVIVQCLLAKKTTDTSGPIGANMKQIHIKQSEWGALAQKWVTSSSSGLDLASHILFDAFPLMSPFEGFRTNDHNLNLVKKMVERGYPESIEFIKNGTGAIKVFQFMENSIEIRVYMKRGFSFTHQSFLLDVPDINIEENANQLREDFVEGLELTISELESGDKGDEKVH